MWFLELWEFLSLLHMRSITSWDHLRIDTSAKRSIAGYRKSHSIYMNEWGNYCLPTLLVDFIINWTIHIRSGGCTNNSMNFLPLSVLGGEWDLVFKPHIFCMFWKNYLIVHVLLKKKQKKQKNLIVHVPYWLVLCPKKKKKSRCNN